MKNLLNKIMKGAFTFSLLLLISSGCEDNLFNVDDRIRVANDNLVISDNFNNFFDDYLLYASFEGDPIPGVPNKALPGLPSGDEIKYAVDDGIFVLYSHQQKSIYLSGNHSVIGEPVGDDDTKISFVSKPGKNSGIVTVTWAGQLIDHHYHEDPNPDNYIDETDGHGIMYLTIKDGNGNFMASLSISGLSVTSLDFTAPFIPNPPAPVNWFVYNLFPNPPIMSQHQFVLTFNLEQEILNIKFVNYDGSIVTQNNLPFPYSTAKSPRFTFSIYTINGGYIVDNVTIKQTPLIGPINPPF